MINLPLFLHGFSTIQTVVVNGISKPSTDMTPFFPRGLLGPRPCWEAKPPLGTLAKQRAVDSAEGDVLVESKLSGALGVLPGSLVYDHEKPGVNHYWLVVSNIFYFQPYLGK